MNSVNLFDVLEEMNSMFDLGEHDEEFPMVGKYSVPAFPPCNVVLTKDGNMVFEFALAGYSKEDLAIDYKNNQIILSTVSNYKPVEFDKETKILTKLIKRPSFKYSYFVPETKFEVEKLAASFDKGILTIIIPAKKQEEAKFKFSIK